MSFALFKELWIADRYSTENFEMPSETIDVDRYCKDSKCILRNPKTGSQSYKKAFENFEGVKVPNDHLTTAHHENEVTIMRNPYDRFRSAIDFQLYSNAGKSGNERPKGFNYLKKFKTFKSMMKVTSFDKLYKEVLSVNTVHAPQFNWVSNNGTVLCYEKGLNEEFTKFFNQNITLPVINKKEDKSYYNKTKQKPDKYWEDSDKLITEIVDYFYKKDLELYKRYCE